MEMGTGYLQVSTLTADGAAPVANAQVRIKDSITGEIIHQSFTDANGNTESFALPAPNVALSLDKNYMQPPYSVFDVDVFKSGFLIEHIHGVQIFDTISSVLPVMLKPLVVKENIPVEEHIYIPVAGLLANGDERQVGVNLNIAKEVIIPEYITVHLGAPTSAARNVRVKFTDYIKNVVSSEIYPTWPFNSIVANVHAIVTFALNRVFTEWYRSRGFNFDITNSTAYDQYFVEGRNIYTNISQIVDEIFNVYVRRFGFRNPFFTQFCNGTTSTCAGLSQWGTVTLANQGKTPLEILRTYYPRDIELVASDNITGIVESFPGYSLRVGSSGDPVRLMQNYLNRIRVNFPLIPQISNPDGVFGPETEAAVRTFQRTFNLTADGVIGRNTWNKINAIFVGATRLAELDSEGIRVGIGQSPPTTVLRTGSTGGDVIELQFILNSIAPYYNTILPVIQDGVFGNSTANSVIEFQRAFNLTPDGVVGPSTWNMLYSVFRSIKENAPVPPVAPPDTTNAPKFPGTALRVGSSGPDVVTMQAYLNLIGKIYTSIPQLVVDGQFGQNTRDAVIAFQQQMLLVPDGIIGQITWDKIVEQFLIATGQATTSLVYPGTALRVGSTGNSVRLMQDFLNQLATVYPNDLPRLVVDGIFGNDTRNAVIAFQRRFGLSQDGIIGPITWDAIIRERNRYFGPQ